MATARLSGSQIAELVVLATEIKHETDVRLTWNAQVPEIGTNSPRQIDVVVESTANGRRFLRIVEVRERGRRADTGWIDAAIGKAQAVGAHRITLVSASGFTQNAMRRVLAQPGLMDALSFRESPPDEWPFQWPDPVIEVVEDGQRFLLPIECRALCEEPSGTVAALVFVGVLDTPLHQALFAAVCGTREQVAGRPIDLRFHILSPDKDRSLERASMTIDLQVDGEQRSVVGRSVLSPGIANPGPNNTAAAEK